MDLLVLACLFGIAYSYFVYPLLLSLLRKFKSTKTAVPAASTEQRSMSLIITVHNEEARIDEKLANSLQIEYPQDKLEIIVASDCSTDATESIVADYAGKGVRLVRADEHLGKEYAQWCAIKAASGDILVFSDAATRIPSDGLESLAQVFLSDQAIGAVSSEDRFISDDGTLIGEGAYVKYEMWLRGIESEMAGLVGLSGSFFAARKEICANWDTESPSDFNTALNCALNDSRAVSSDSVIGFYKDVKDSSKEYQRKVRTVIRGITALARHAEVLNPFKLGFFSFQVWSHKVMRWLVPWFMLLLAAISFANFGHSWFIKLVCIGQLGFYALALAGWRSPELRENVLVRLVFFFVQVNAAIAQATISFVSGKRMTVWTPSRR